MDTLGQARSTVCGSTADGMAGRPERATDATIESIRPFLEPGDILIDGGNSLYTDTDRRAQELREAAPAVACVPIEVLGQELAGRVGAAVGVDRHLDLGHAEHRADRAGLLAGVGGRIRAERQRARGELSPLEGAAQVEAELRQP